MAEKHGLPLIADEIYKDMVFDGESKSFGELSEHVPVISCGGLAKRYVGFKCGKGDKRSFIQDLLYI